MEKTLTDKQKTFLEVLFGPEAKGNIKEAMRIAGYSPTAPSSVVTGPLKEEISEKTKEFLSSVASVKAAYTMYSSLDITDKAELIGLRERLSAARDLLDRGGQVVTQKIEVESSSPIFILPPKDKETD